MSDPITLATELRRYLKSTGLTQAELAKRIGVTQSWISGFLDGRYDNPRLDTLNAVYRFANSHRAMQEAQHQ